MKKVSIICRCYNFSNSIAKAIESCLKQTYTNWELIIVDDCSTDDSADIIKLYKDERIHFYQNEYNLGVIGNLNKGLTLSTGDYITILDGDDYFYPEKIAKQVDFLNNNPDYGAVFSYIDFDYNKQSKKYKQHLDNLINRPSKSQEEMLNFFFYHENNLAFPTEMFRRSLTMEFPETLIGTGDYNFHIHTLLNSKIKVLEEPLVKYNTIGMSHASTMCYKTVNIERILLLEQFLKFKNVELFKKVFKDSYKSFGEPDSVNDIPYFIARLALDSNFSEAGAVLLQKIFADTNYFQYIQKKFKLTYREYLNLRNKVNQQNTIKKTLSFTYYKRQKETTFCKETFFKIFSIIKKPNIQSYYLLGIKIYEKR